MRRLTGLVLSALLAVAGLAVLPGAAVADDGPPVPLAAEAEEGGDEGGGAGGGPDPMPREQEENPARELGGYDDLETPFTWGAAFIMLFLGVVGLVLLSGLYWLLVHRPSRES